MVDFANYDDARRWCEGQPREVAVAMAARAALRVLPLIGPGQDRSAARHRSAVVLPSFRAAAVPWVAAIVPTRGVELRAAAYASARAVDTAYSNAPHDAVYAAARAADAAYTDDVRLADAAAYTADASFAAATAADAASFADAQTAVGVALPVVVVRTAAIVAAEADAAFIDAGGDAEQRRRLAADLAGRPLWPGDTPSWAASAWTSMKRALTAAHEDWDVWTAFYDALLAGHAPSDPAVALAYVTLPEDLWKAGPKAVNAGIRRRIFEVREKSELLGEPIPRQGVGPHFILGSSDTIELAPPSEFDADGNNLARVREFLPLARQAADDVVKHINSNLFPELARDAAAYRGAIDGDAQAIAWGVVFGRGLILENAAAAAQREIDDRLSAPLEDAPQTALASLLALHGPLILATAEGHELHEQATSLQMTRAEQTELRTTAQALAAKLEQAPEIIAPAEATIVVDAADAIGEGRHPERGSVFGSATIKHVTIVLVSAALVGAPVAAVGLAGAPFAWVGYEALKRTSFYKEATAALGTRFEHIVERGEEGLRQWAVRLTPFRRFVMQNEASLRQIATTMPQSRWMLRYIDVISRTNAAPTDEP